MLSEVNSIAVVDCGLMNSSIAKTLGATGMKVATWNRTGDAVNNLAAFGVNHHSPVKGSPPTGALYRTLDQACSSGLSQHDVAATICHWIKPG